MEKSEVLNVRVNESEKKKIKILSMKAGLTQSDFLRRLINEEFSRKEKKENFEEKVINEISSLKTKIDVSSHIGLMNYIDRMIAFLDQPEMLQKDGEADDVYKARVHALEQRIVRADLRQSAALLRLVNKVLDE
jgi:hypothetical protein